MLRWILYLLKLLIINDIVDQFDQETLQNIKLRCCLLTKEGQNTLEDQKVVRGSIFEPICVLITVLNKEETTDGNDDPLALTYHIILVRGETILRYLVQEWLHLLFIVRLKKDLGAERLNMLVQKCDQMLQILLLQPGAELSEISQAQ